MRLWIIKANEPKPVLNNESRLGRMGLLAEELAERGNEVIWYTSTFSHLKKEQIYKEDTTVNIKENYVIEFIKTYGYKKNISLGRILSYRHLAHKFKKMSKKTEKPDIIYVAFPTIELAEKAIKYGEENNVPVVVDVRDLWPDIFNHNLSGVLKILAKPYIEFMDYKAKKIMKKAYNITAISSAMLEWGKNKGTRFDNKNDKYFYMGYKKQAKGLEITDEQKSKMKIDKNTFNIIFVGTLIKQFNFDILIQVAQELKNNGVKFYVCGTGNRVDEIKEKTKDLENFIMTGWLEKEELNYILKNMDMGFAPYNNTFDFQSSISNKFAEYLCYGLPVIITSDGCMAEIIEKNEIGIASRDIKKISEFIIKLKNNKEEYEKKSKRALEIYNNEFMADKVYKELAEYLEKIVKSYKKL